MAMALTCGNFAGKSRCYALVVFFTLVQRAETGGYQRRNDVSAPPRAPGPRRLPVRMQPRVTARIVFHESALYGSAARHTQRRPVTLTQYFTWH